MRCCKAVCSVNPRATNLKATQKPVKTEHRATKRPWGRRLSLLPFLGRPKKRTSAGTFGRLTSAPSPARTRSLFFHSIAEANRRSYRCRRRSPRPFQKPIGSPLRPWQNASSVTPASSSHGKLARINPQAWVSPWVMEQTCRPTYIVNQATTSGTSGRRRRGAQPASHATAAKSSAVRMDRKGASPNCPRTSEAARRAVPIESMSSASLPVERAAVIHDQPLLNHPSAHGGFFHWRILT